MADNYQELLEQYVTAVEKRDRTSDFDPWDKLQSLLIARYPALLSDVRCGVTCPPGWIPLVSRLCDQLQDAMEVYPGLKITVEQVKEKFASLRFYTTVQHESEDVQRIIWAMIDEYSAESETVCQICGDIGEVGGSGWIRTTCDKHASL